MSNCITSERGYLYLAEDLEEVGAEPDATEILEVRKIPFARCMEMVDLGEIVDALSILGLLQAKRLLERRG